LKPTIGERLSILPNHACAVVNLARGLTVAEKADIEAWPVDAHACVS
jgi:D-serine deaminase-like pyridoxal phosphate-dependent protein